MRINGFEQIKSFYSWVFNNPDKARPTHISLYLFLWNQGNRANWTEWFKCPYDLAMQGACIGSKSTYYKCLDDLQKFGLIQYRKGINLHKAPQIHLIQLYKSGQLTEQVSVPLSEPLSEPQGEPLSVLLSGNIYKLLTDNHETVNKQLVKWLNSEKKNPTAIIKENNIELRKLKFSSTLEPYESIYGRPLLKEFNSYWTEPNKSNTKFKQELEKTWSLERRLSTWAKNDKNFNNGKSTKQFETANDRNKRASDERKERLGKELLRELHPDASETDIESLYIEYKNDPNNIQSN